MLAVAPHRCIASDVAVCARCRSDITVVAVCPGYCKTDMTGHNDGAQDPAIAVTGILKVSKGLTAADSGKFFRYTGDEIAW